MFARQGVPGILVSDNGPQFTSKMFKDFCKSEGIKHVTSAPYCPQSNGVVERFHRTLKEMLAKIVDKKGNWPEMVPVCLKFIRLTPNATTGFSPYMLTQGWEPSSSYKLCTSAGWAM